jgi:hypothetical protein
MLKALFKEKQGGFRREDSVSVARELGFEVVGMPKASEKIEYTYHKQQQAGEGFWALAPGAEDASEGMVSVSKKSSQ